MKPESRRFWILIADDDQDERFLIGSELSRAGYCVETANDGEAAWETLNKRPFDLLCTDHNMPKLNGLDLVARMRSYGMNLPVIVYSGRDDLQKCADHRDLKLEAVLHKSEGLSRLLGSVRQLLPSPVAIGDKAMSTSTNPGLAPNYGAHTIAPYSSPVEVSSPQLATGSIQRPCVLVADDDSFVRQSLAAVLESEGFLVQEASDGLEAAAAAVHKKPDVVLLDLNMPRMDGWAAFAQIEQMRPLLQVIIITARPHQYHEAVRLGVDAFMEKPLNIPVLVKSIKELANESPHRHLNRITGRGFHTQLL